jgi:hypothetical protein
MTDEVLSELIKLVEFYREAYLDQKERADSLESKLFKLLRFPDETTEMKMPATIQPIHKSRRSNWPRQQREYERLSKISDAAAAEIDETLKGA